MISHWHIVYFRFPLELSRVLAGYVLLHVAFPVFLVRACSEKLKFLIKYLEGSSIKLLSTKVEKTFLLRIVLFYPVRACHHLCQVKTNQITGFTMQTFVRAARKISWKYKHNGYHLGLLIKTDNTHKEKMMSQTIIHTFEKCKGGKTVSSDCGVQMVVVLIIN